MEENKKIPGISVNIEDFDNRVNDPRFIQVKQDAEGKELVLFLGATGAGKSTCINYLLGAKIDRDIDGSGETIAKLATTQDETAISKRLAKVSPGIRQPCTLYSEIFDDSILKIAYCDTAGVLSPLGTAKELQICASFSLQYAIECAKSIKAIVIVVEWYIFTTNRPLELYALALLLTQLLVDPEKNTDSIIFLINKVPKNIKKQNVAYAISCYKDILTQEVETITKKTHPYPMPASDLEKREHIVRMINLLDVKIKEKPENIILMDVFDEGNTREAIYTLLKEKKFFLTKENFDFNEYNENRKAFDAKIEVIAPLMQVAREKKLNREKKQEKLLSNTIVLDGTETEPSSTLQREIKQPDPISIENLSDKKLTTHSHQDIPNKISINNHQIKSIETATSQSIHQPENSTQITHKTGEKYVSTNGDNPKKGHDIVDIVLDLVEKTKSKENPNNTPKNLEPNPDIQRIKTPEHQNNRQEIEIGPLNDEVSPITPTKIIRIFANLGGAAIGLFGIFLLGTGIGALAHGTLGASILQALFKTVLNDAIAYSFIYGFFCLFLSSTIFYIANVVTADNQPNIASSSNMLEDVTSNNGYGTFEQPPHMQNNSTAPLLKKNIPVQRQKISNQNGPLFDTYEQGKISDGLV